MSEQLRFEIEALIQRYAKNEINDIVFLKLYDDIINEFRRGIQKQNIDDRILSIFENSSMRELLDKLTIEQRKFLKDSIKQNVSLNPLLREDRNKESKEEDLLAPIIKKCPNCHSDNLTFLEKDEEGNIFYKCNNCGEEFGFLTEFGL